MSANDITMQSVEEVSKQIKAKKVSPVEFTKACLERVKKLDGELNAFVCLTEEIALAQANKAEEEIAKGGYKGPLHGVPIAFKDLFYTKGVATTGSSEVLRDFVPDFNGTIVQRMLDAGGVMIGKTNTHEFAFGPTTEESCFGPTRNPWNTKKITGGSSGGSTVAAVTGMSYITMGSDTGGSVRIPAAMCSAVGFKPSYGLGSLYGIIGLSFNLDHPGPICRSVVDCAIAMDAFTGTDPKDPCPGAIVGAPTRFYEGLDDVGDLKGKVFGIPTNFFFDKTDYEVERVFNEAVENLKKLGADVRYLEVPALDLVTDASTCILFSEAAYTHKPWYPSRKDKYQAGVAARLDMGLGFSAVQYIQGLKDRERIMAEWENTLKSYDAILAPACPIEAFDIGLGEPWNVVTRGKTEPGKAMATYHTRLANMTGAPAISVPAGLTKNNLPVGLMIMGARNNDLGVLRLARAYEKNVAYPALKL
jgi:aspartyl-tRNA(Asn)/glutamyl-tRNA(Gln) amidotransferase subunit A